MKKTQRTNLLSLLKALLLLPFLGGGAVVFAQSTPSPLASGLWVKIAVSANGVYRVSYEELRKQGFPDPSKVGVFGFGGALLSERLAERPQESFPSVPVMHRDEALFFYGQGPTKLEYDEKDKILRHVDNHYSTEGFYFLSDALPIKPISEEAIPATNTVQEASYYDGYYRHEAELFSLKQSGRLLFGEPLINGNNVRITLETAPNVLSGEGTKLTVAYSSLPSISGKLTVKSNGASVLEDDIHKSEGGASSDTEVYLKGIYHRRTVDFGSSGAGSPIFDCSFSPATERAHIDFIALHTRNSLTYNDGKQLSFRRMSNAGTTLRFAFSHLPSEAQVWAIFSPNDIRRAPLKGKAFVADVMKSNGQPLEFVAFHPADAFTPRIVGKIENSNNIRGHEGVPDLVIISTKAFLPEAERLARFHREKRALNVLVTSQEAVFNEFSSGTPDGTAYRLLNKYFYDRWEKNASIPKGTVLDARTINDICPMHLLLFGDGACDNRLLSSEWKRIKDSGTELLLTYESINSLDISSFTADDYFGVVRDGEDDLHIGAKTLCLGIGRFTVRTPFEATAAVDKCIYYAENRLLGDWKTKGCIVADDGNGYGHLVRGEQLATDIAAGMPEMMITKIYFDAFPKQNKNGLTTFPGARRKLFETFNKGLLLVNYTGHGNPNAWSDEQILTTADIRRFDYSHLPLWITATCDFADFDGPITSAGESAFLNAKSGAIGLITTSRVVYDSFNQALNRAILNALFKKRSDGASISFGKAVNLAKNEVKKSWGEMGLINNLHFFLIGDPTLDFNLPTRKAVIETINDITPIDSEGIPLKALQRVKIKGSIRDGESAVDGNFTGNMAITIFDSQTIMKTLESNRPSGVDRVASFKDYPGLMYAGNTKVESGQFEFEFIVPKDLAYNEGRSRINIYAHAPDHKLEAMGMDTTAYITSGSGSDEVDNTPPEIRRCFLNDSTLQSNFVTGPTPVFIADIFDKSGINLSSGGVGHQITLVIDNRLDYTFVLNDYFEASALEAGLGHVVYTLPEITEGDHEALFTVWDVFNNSTVHRFRFRVNKDLKPGIAVAAVYPNPIPFGQEIGFHITTDSPREEFNGFVELVDFTGRVVARSEKFTFKSEPGTPAEIKWNPQTNYGTYPVPGLYLFRWTVTAPNGKTSFTTGKLVVTDNNIPAPTVE